MHTNLLIAVNLKSSLRIVTDLAFDSIDEDGSGGLDQEEIAGIME